MIFSPLATHQSPNLGKSANSPMPKSSSVRRLNSGTATPFMVCLSVSPNQSQMRLFPSGKMRLGPSSQRIWPFSRMKYLYSVIGVPLVSTDQTPGPSYSIFMALFGIQLPNSALFPVRYNSSPQRLSYLSLNVVFMAQK